MANEELFTNAPKESVLFRLSQKNVYAHPDVSAESMVESTDLLAYYNSVTNVAEYNEFKTCLVSLLTIPTVSIVWQLWNSFKIDQIDCISFSSELCLLHTHIIDLIYFARNPI